MRLYFRHCNACQHYLGMYCNVCVQRQDSKDVSSCCFKLTLLCMPMLMIQHWCVQHCLFAATGAIMLDDLFLQTDTAMHSGVRGYLWLALHCFSAWRSKACIYERLATSVQVTGRMIQHWCGLHCVLEAIGAYTFDALLMWADSVMHADVVWCKSQCLPTACNT